MKIKINNKSVKIKPASELTVKEYILLFDDLTKQTSNFEILIKYISITTGIKYNRVADININENSIRRLFSYIGEIPNVKDISQTKEFYYRFSGKRLYQKSVNWRSMAVRGLLEERAKGYLVTTKDIDKVTYPYENEPEKKRITYKKVLKNYNQLEIAVYLLAVYISNDYDCEVIEEIYNDLQGYNAIEVFSFIVFFFKRLLSGRTSDKSFLIMLRKKVNISTQKLFVK